MVSPNRPAAPTEQTTVQDTLSERVLLATPIVTIGEFRCPARDPLWSRENVAAGNLVVFPRVPVLIAQADRDPVVADANRVMFYDAGRAYTRARISDAGDQCEFFAVGRTLAEDVMSAAGALAQHDLFPFADGPGNARAYAAQRLIYEHVAACPTPDVLRVEAAFIAVFGAVVGDALDVRSAHARRPARQATRRTHAELIEMTRSILAADPAQPLSLSELARRVEASPCHLCRVFRSRTGLTITRFRDRLRLCASLEPLAEPRADLTHIAHAFGFCSHSHYTRAFRREFGLTPSAFRTHATRARKRELINLVTAA